VASEPSEHENEVGLLCNHAVHASSAPGVADDEDGLGATGERLGQTY
jgi:hypothetical protein